MKMKNFYPPVLFLVMLFSGLLFSGSGLADFALVLWFVSGLIIIVKGADCLVDGSSGFARHFRVSPLIIGLTIVSFGTSAPELAVSVIASLTGSSGISIGNIVGSNIFNIGMILGLTAMILPLSVGLSTVKIESPFMVLASFLLFILSFSFLDSSPGPYVLGRIDGLVFLLLFSVFMYYTVTGAKRERKSAIRIPGDEKGNVRGFLTAMVLGIAGVIIGGEILVYTATGMAKSLGISEAVIGLTVVAAGTSLPELATNIMAALKKEGQIAIGNIIGSNIFNILLVLGVAAAISPMEVAASFVNFDMIVMILFSVLLSFFIFTGRRLSRKEGFALFAGFLSYLGCLFYLTFA